jgi:5-methylcytosine-specific restriction endonuclease McrA
MGRLRTIKPRLTSLPSRLAAPTSEQERNRKRDADLVHRAWYNSRRWRKLREKIWARDLYTCQQTGEICTGKHPAGNSPVADHIVPHRGNEALFWDESNLQTVSKAYHDSQKQREEKSRW